MIVRRKLRYRKRCSFNNWSMSSSAFCLRGSHPFSRPGVSCCPVPAPNKLVSQVGNYSITWNRTPITQGPSTRDLRNVYDVVHLDSSLSLPIFEEGVDDRGSVCWKIIERCMGYNNRPPNVRKGVLQ